MTFEPYQFEHHFSADPVFDSVVALYAYDRIGRDPGVRHELSDSVVLLNFEDYAWNNSHVRSGAMMDWHRENNKFRRPNKRKRPNETVCRRGHPMTAENTLMHNGAKTCKTCNKLYAREWRRKQHEVRA